MLMTSSKKKMMEKLKMPAKSAPEQDDNLDLGDEDVEGSPAEEAAESPEEESSEVEPETDNGEQPSKAAQLSDDELLAELKKRGLDKQMSGEDDTQDGHTVMA